MAATAERNDERLQRVKSLSPEDARERKGYYKTGYATGPDTIAFILWTAGCLEVAGRDSICGHSSDGFPSGVSVGTACTPYDKWNQTLWMSVNGGACFVSGTFFSDNKYVYDAAMPGCMDAFQAYRLAPQYTGGVPFTCNCSGDHAYLGYDGGLRPATVVLLATTITIIAIAMATPVFGSWIDFSNHRLSTWYKLYVCTTICTFGSCILATGYLWVIGLVFFSFTAFFTELAMIPRGVHAA